MDVGGEVAIVTGGGGGIGGAIARRLAAAGAHVIVADIDIRAARMVTASITRAHPGRALAVEADVSVESQIRELIGLAESTFGPVNLYLSNAGVGGGGGIGTDRRDWDSALEVNLRAPVRAARLLIPQWLERGGGYFIVTASAAGLLSQIGSAPYAVTKHAALAFAEWLSITYHADRIKVSCLCPMGVDTPMLTAAQRASDPLSRAMARSVTDAGPVLDPNEVAEMTLDAIGEERFLVLPHPDVLTMFRRKASDYERWLRGMRRYQAELLAQSR